MERQQATVHELQILNKLIGLTETAGEIVPNTIRNRQEKLMKSLGIQIVSEGVN